MKEIVIDNIASKEFLKMLLSQVFGSMSEKDIENSPWFTEYIELNQLIIESERDDVRQSLQYVLNWS